MTKRIFLACTLGLVHAAYGLTATWNVDANGAWDLDGNWTAAYPNAATETANFLGVISTTRTISTSSAITVGNINFNNSNTYAISLGANILSLDNAGTANITVTTGSHSITAPISLVNPLLFTNNSAGAFTIAGVTSGANSLTKAGTGTLILTAANLYSTGTTINDGTLSLSGAGSLVFPSTVNVNSGTSIFDISAITGITAIGDLSSAFAGSKVVLGNKTLIFGTATPSTTFAGVISGGVTGAITKLGTGTVVLTGANTFAGGTIVSSGTLALSGSGSLSFTGPLQLVTTFDITAITAAGTTIGDFPSEPGSTVLLGGKSLTFGTTASVTNQSAFSGVGGSIIKIGSGTVVLTGVSTYDGGTTINAGTLSLSGAGSLLSTGAVNVNSASSVFNIGAITAPGTTIGELVGVAGSSVVLGSKALTFGTGAGATFAGSISSSGSIMKQGSGIATFSGTNTFIGGTTINDGTLSLSGAGALAPTGAVIVNSASSVFDITAITAATTIGDLSGVSGSSVAIGIKSLTFGTTTSTTFAGSISGSGTIAKQGSGVFTVTGANAFIGTFNVNVGELNMASTGSFPFASTTNIAGGTTLTGIGTLGAVNLNGTVSPGNSIGTINVGNITFNSGSNFLIELSDTASDQIISSGVVTINPGAILSLMGSGLTTPLSSYLVIDSSAPLVRNGDFTLVNPFTRFHFVIQYDPQDVTLLFLESVTNFFAAGNAAGPASCFASFFNNLPPDLIPILNILNVQTIEEWQDSFNQMQPSNLDDIAYAQENVAEHIRQSFSAHLFEQRIESCPNLLPWRLWLTPFVEHVHQHGKGENAGYKENFRGVTVAADYQFMNRWTLTSGFSYADSNVDIGDGKASGDLKTYAGSVGAIWKNSHFFADGLLSYLFSSVSGQRKMLFVAPTRSDISFSAPPVSLKARHNQDTNQVMGHLGGGYNFKVDAGDRGTLNVYPFVNVDYLFVMQPGYKEIGAHSLNLSVSSKNYDLLRPEVGFGVGYAGCFERARVNADVSVSFIREQRFFGKTTKAHFQDSSCTFTAKGLSPNNNLVSPTARITVSTTKASPISFSIGYHGEFGSHFIENAGDAEIKVSF